MSALSAKVQEDLLQELRQEISRLLGVTEVHCGIAQDYLFLADDCGLKYSLRHLTTYVRAIEAHFTDLQSRLSPPISDGERGE